MNFKLMNWQHMIFFEPVTWDDFGVGFDSVPGGEDYSNRSVLSYHYYEPPDIGLFEAFTVRSEDMDKLHCGGFLTEFDMTGDMDDVIATMDVADLFLQSWTGWQFKKVRHFLTVFCSVTFELLNFNILDFFDICVKYWPITGWTYGLYNSSGGLNVELVKVMSRTYARAVAGHAVSMFYDTQSGDFELEYEMDPTCTQPTEIYLNEALNYPMGYKVTISPDVATWKRVAENIIHIMPATSSQPQSVQVVITKN
jgi:endoglycosylceramidase